MDLSPRQQINLLDLYSDQIAMVLKDSSEAELAVFRDYLAPDIYRTIKENMKSMPRNGAMELWNALLSSSMQKSLYNDTLGYLKNVNKKLHSKLALVDEGSERAKFGDILRHAHRIIPVMDISTILQSLRAKSAADYEFICMPVEDCSKAHGNAQAARLLLRNLPSCGRDGYYDLFDALGKMPEGLAVRNELDPHFKAYYDCYQVDKLCRDTRVKFIPIGVSIEEALLAADDDPRFTVDLSFEHLPIAPRSRSPGRRRRLSDFSSAEVAEDTERNPMEPVLEPEVKLELRPYQDELTKHALEGKNTVICAPTGSGKTIVAIKIIREHLLEGERLKEKRKVCFLVPSTVLVEQQEKQINRYLKHRWEVKGLSGSESALPKVPTVRSAHVIVITPQLIVNMMQNEDPADRLKLTEFSLMIFDEAHHADEKHPYNEIMREYHNSKYTDRMPSGESLPQIVGLTASLGAGGKGTNDTADAVQHVLKMCTNLCVEQISCVRDNIEDLKAFTNANRDAVHLLENNHTEQLFYGIVTSLMKQIEDELLPLLEQFRAAIDNAQLSPQLSRGRHQPAYENWFSNLLGTHIPCLNIDPTTKLKLSVYLQELKMYFKTLDYHAHLPPINALNFLKKREHEIAPTEAATLWLQQIVKEREAELEQAATSTNGLIEELCRRLQEEFSSNQEARAIVFVRTRELTMELEEVLNQRLGPDIKTSRLTSINTSTDQGGQAAAEQAMQLENFRSGVVRILVSTTVAEEGLDIAQCSLVIKYNYATNEIALVQRRGRGRAEGSQSVLLTQEKWIADKEKANQQREQLMLEALDRIAGYGTEWFNSQIRGRTVELQQERQRELALAAERRQRLAGHSYFLRCKRCDAELCRSEDIRVVCNSHYVCVDRNITQRIIHLPVPLEEFETMSLEGQSFCISCQALLGTVIKFRNVNLPTFGANNIVLQETNNPDKRHTEKKWKKIKETLFEPPVIQTRDLTEMKEAALQIANLNQFVVFQRDSST